jgi:hypothetical protein
MKILRIKAWVRFYEDSEINGVDDINEEMFGINQTSKMWEIDIDLENNSIIGWNGVEAKINYKVCDAGEYFLIDTETNEKKQYVDDYVPDCISHEDDGSYGDYIIFSVNTKGEISSYDELHHKINDKINIEEWK